MGGMILKEKAEYFTKSLGHNTFSASNGWLDKFNSEIILRFEIFMVKLLVLIKILAMND